eukprot:3092-Heterococcus_DN1.PRE.2
MALTSAAQLPHLQSHKTTTTSSQVPQADAEKVAAWWKIAAAEPAAVLCPTVWFVRLPLTQPMRCKQ